MGGAGAALHEFGASRGADWTFQRHLTWAACPRRYWFQYVAQGDEKTSEADRVGIGALKRMSSLGYLRGLALHTQIRRLVPRLLKGERVDEDAAALAMAQWVDDWAADAAQKVTEARNGAAVGREVFDEIKREAQGELEAFLEKRWREVAALGLEGLQVEKTAVFLVDRAAVMARLDLVGRRKDGGAMVVDWKTGEDDPAYESEFQMSVYALAAIEAGFGGGRQVEATLIFLKSGATKSFRFTPPQLGAARDKIRRDLKVIQPPPKREAAPAMPEPKRCLACNFATVCDAADLSGAARGPWG
jgi:CRISPR/Cas system-associated exonuclease Cas4 (RecB family)